MLWTGLVCSGYIQVESSCERANELHKLLGIYRMAAQLVAWRGAELQVVS
jgi:hypothetical protein